jgi:hypothetical protein
MTQLLSRTGILAVLRADIAYRRRQVGDLHHLNERAVSLIYLESAVQPWFE